MIEDISEEEYLSLTPEAPWVPSPTKISDSSIERVLRYGGVCAPYLCALVNDMRELGVVPSQISPTSISLVKGRGKAVFNVRVGGISLKKGSSERIVVNVKEAILEACRFLDEIRR